MAGEPDGSVSPVESPAVSAVEDKSKEETKPKEAKKKKKKGFFSRIWNAMFGGRNDDFERRLERISKEENTVLTRMRRRAQSWGRMRRHLILFSVLLEIVAISYAIMTARTAEDWKIRAFRVLPMFLLPALSSAIYSGIRSFVNMCERKDQKTLENLRAERQAKIDELKEKTNYYITQQLIQRYDTDPAAKAAAATVLASKLGAESGMKVLLEDESKLNVAAGRSHDVELVQSSGLRNRKQPQSRGTSPREGTLQHPSTETTHMGTDYPDHNQPLYVDHYQPQGSGSSSAYNSGWLSRIAALLVGEDPTQCFALICGNCHMHNGLASKEDFPYVTYICPHCGAVNGPKIKREHPSGDNVSGSTVEDHGHAGSISGDSPRDNLDQGDNTNAKAAETAPLVAQGTDKPEVAAASNDS